MARTLMSVRIKELAKARELAAVAEARHLRATIRLRRAGAQVVNAFIRVQILEGLIRGDPLLPPLPDSDSSDSEQEGEHDPFGIQPTVSRLPSLQAGHI